ncbi:hypothetical protein SpCBS45565_g04961 [Spizellomyces sp. 'palustris']|nr:hypothetical protein SpCBS45565_g04961 [Spizellomyces sp. 'palustris']
MLPALQLPQKLSRHPPIVVSLPTDYFDHVVCEGRRSSSTKPKSLQQLLTATVSDSPKNATKRSSTNSSLLQVPDSRRQAHRRSITCSLDTTGFCQPHGPSHAEDPPFDSPLRRRRASSALPSTKAMIAREAGMFGDIVNVLGEGQFCDNESMTRNYSSPPVTSVESVTSPTLTDKSTQSPLTGHLPKVKRRATIGHGGDRRAALQQHLIASKHAAADGASELSVKKLRADVARLDIDGILAGKYDTQFERILHKMKGSSTQESTSHDDDWASSSAVTLREADVEGFLATSPSASASNSAATLPRARSGRIESLRARQNWTYAIGTVRKILRATLIFRTSKKTGKDQENDESQNEQTSAMAALFQFTTATANANSAVPSLHSHLTSLNLRDTAAITSKIASLIQMAATERTAKQESRLDTMLCRCLPMTFAKHSKRVRREMARIAIFERVGEGRIVVKAGHHAWNYFYILSGTCLSNKISDWESVAERRSSIANNLFSDRPRGHIQGYLSPGDAFGEYALSQSTDLRSETVTTLTPCEFIRIEREDYLAHLASQDVDPSALHNRISFLSSLPVFRRTSKEIIVQLAKAAKAVRFEVDTTVLAPYERDLIVFLMRGQCKAVRIVEMMDGNAVTKDPEPAARQVSQEQDETTGSPSFHTMQSPAVVSIGNFYPGDYFPRLYLDRSEALTYRMHNISAAKLHLLVATSERRISVVEALQNQNQSVISKAASAAAGLDLSAIAMQPCDCLCIPRLDLVGILDDDTLKTLMSPVNEGILSVPVSELQRKLLKKEEWDHVRQMILDKDISRPRRGL